MGQGLVPEGYGGDIVLQGQITSAASPAKRLDRNPEPFTEPDRIGEMPAIHAEPELTAVEPVRCDHLMQSAVRSREGTIMVVTDRILEIVRTTEIVFRTGSADRRIITVIVQIELDFTFAPPAAVIHAPGHIGADIVPMPSTPSRIVYTS